MSAVIALAGCLETADSGHRAPVVQYGQNGGAESTGMHTVSGGDTVWTIAQGYKLSMQDIIRVNHLSPPYNLPAGTRLKLPPPATYNVRPNDSLYTISQTFSASVTEMARLNNLSPPYRIREGQALKVPAMHTPTRTAPPQMVARIERIEQQQQGREQRMAYVPPPATVHAQPLPAPAGQQHPWQLPQPAPTVATPAQPKPAPTAVVAKAPPRAGGKFGWPVRGTVISGYGPKEGGLHNDGINIEAERGAPVYAAENGVIVYAGGELKGFGNMILIKHADRWVTAYAHMDSITAQRGQQVKMGDVIGTVGSTGSVGSPQLHFETRRGTEALNPVVYLGKSQS